MVKKDRNTLGYLGEKFQLKFIGQLLTDHRYAESVIDIVKPEYFDDEKLRCIIMYIKNNYEQYDTIPDYNSLEGILHKELSSFQLDHCLALLTKAKDLGLNNTLQVQDTAKTFFKQQETIKAARQILKIAEGGDLDRYVECEDLLKKALEFGADKDELTDVFDDIDDVLSDDFRDPIPTGIEGLDKSMDGGLSKGELGLIIAPLGVGKTTLATKIANEAKNLGYNVLQIFFEDQPKVIKRKHYACWSGINLNELAERREEVKEIVDKRLTEPGQLKLRRFPSNSLTITMLRNYIRKLTSQGFKPDMVLLDYIDCIKPSQSYSDDNIAQGDIMREYENMLFELDIAGWTFTQGNRSSISSEIVEGDQIGGSIKKAQIAHFIASIAKTLQQKEDSTANVSILKSRFGVDGIVFRDCVFDNGTLRIETSDQDNGVSFFSDKENKKTVDKERIAEVFKQYKEKNLEDTQ